MMNFTLKKVWVGMILLLLPCLAQAQRVAVKTNALLWGNLTPNLSVELVSSKRVSLEGNVFYSLNNTPTDCRLKGAEAEVRYWLSGRAMTQLFVGLSVTGTQYVVTTGGKMRHDGDAGGPGVVIGYDLPLGTHWNLEFAAGAGALWFREKQYEIATDNSKLPYNASGCKFMPTKLAVAVAYVF